MNFILSLIRDSTTLDIRTFFIKDWSLSKKIKFLDKKYFLIIKHLFKEFELGKDSVVFAEKKIFYDSKYGLAGYQGILCRQRNLLIKIGKVSNASCIIDVGANVGFFSMLCRDLYPKSIIYSFEPIPNTFECLRKNFKGDKNTKVFNLALGDFPGEMKMSFDKDNSATSKIDDQGDISVKVDTLDNFRLKENIKSIDILKIDTETFENYVLLGAQNILNKVKYILMEVTIKDNDNYTISSLFKLLSTEKYDFQIIGFRNFTNSGEGVISVMDVLLRIYT